MKVKTDDTEEPRYIKVRYAVFIAAEGLKDEAAALGLPEFNIAERNRQRAHEDEDERAAAFWDEVVQYWMERECLAGSSLVVIGKS